MLDRRPAGEFVTSDLRRVSEPVPGPGQDQTLVRNTYLSLDPSNRIWMGEGESYMPPVALGEVMRGKIRDRQTIVSGLDQAPAALTGMFNGTNIGKLIVEI